MNRYLPAALLFSLAFPYSGTSLADQWKGQGEAGFVRASGNTDSESANVGLRFENVGDVWSHELLLSTYQASNSGQTSADNFSAAYKLKRELSDKSYLFGSLSYLDDDFDGFTEQSSMSLGYGHKVIDSESTKWDLELGLGYRDTQELLTLANGTKAEGDDLSGATLVLNSSFQHQLTDNTQFVDKFRSEAGSDNTFIENDAALIVSMNDRFALKAGVLIRHNTDPAPGADDTDTITSLNLVYNFNQ